jgi:hypothetical protein
MVDEEEFTRDESPAGGSPGGSEGEDSATASEPIELVEEQLGDRVDLGHPPPEAFVPAESEPGDMEEAGHKPPKLEVAPSKPPPEPVPPPSKPSTPGQSDGDSGEPGEPPADS